MSIAILPMGLQFAYSDATKGVIAAGFSVGYGFGLLPAGVASSTSSPKWVLLSGLLLWSVAQASSPAAASIGLPALLFARAMMGLGEAAAIPSLQSIAKQFVPADRRSLFWGCLSASLSSGTIAAYTLTPPLIDAQGWPFVFEAYGAAGAGIALLWAIWGASEPKATTLPASATAVGTQVLKDAPITTSAATIAVTAKAAEADMWADMPWQAIAASPRVWALTTAHMSSNFFMYFGLSWLPTFFNYQWGLSTAEASAASMLPYVAGAFGSLTAGIACDTLVSRANLELTRARKVMQSIGCGGPAVAMLALCCLTSGAIPGLTPERSQVESLFIFAIACQACSAAGYGCAAQDISTRLAALIYGGTSVFAVAFGAMGQFFTGWLLEVNGRDFTPMFALTAFVELLGLITFCKWWSSEVEFE
eukprot:CAMPEP_0119336454 /NCGR_PEP_ID=MMETSP1333-20130426/91882_1 /TAXON_ID=418940 /ORGANISM="Scyphosphaera apsteinii, Strain RCC1455" /LENGTH=419 /DNA_ID=CAMNT_0007347263 /DNA_START=308 /DNA_END=1567 /DNA_ORIENTATION=-